MKTVSILFAFFMAVSFEIARAHHSLWMLPLGVGFAVALVILLSIHRLEANPRYRKEGDDD